MGLLSKILILTILIFAAYYAYDTVTIKTITICTEQEKTETQVTCVTSSDCARYMTSLYGDYPDTTMYRYILTQTTTCNLGKCEINQFEIKDQCAPTETAIKHQATLKDIITATQTGG